MPTLLRVLTAAGLGPRRACFALITSGAVRVNGVVADGAALEVAPAVDVIEVEGRRIADAAPLVYVKVHKPAGVLSAVSDARGRRTVVDLLPTKLRSLRLYPVGRLDLDSTGLVLLTNDGDLAYRLMHPRYGYEKEYHVRLPSPLTASNIAALAEGVLLDGRRTAPARVAALDGSAAVGDGGPWYSVTLAEGRKRQVRRMLASVGAPPLALRRVRIHTLLLGELAEGASAPLTAAELAGLGSSPPSTPASA